MRGLVLTVLLAAPAFAGSPRVLLIWDVKTQQTDALAKALTNAGLEVVLSETDEIRASFRSRQSEVPDRVG